MKRYMQMFLMTKLVMGTCMVMLSTHWFSMWMGLELSTLAILPLLTSNQISRSNEATLKYFLVQAFSAALLLKGVLMKVWLTNKWKINLTNNPLPKFLILFSLMTKLGLAPCHFWFPDVLSGLSFLKGLIVSCWQKIAPLYLIITLNSSFPNELILISGILSVLMGGWKGLNQTSMRKILAFSSMSHLGWMISMSFFNKKMSLILFFLYIMMTSLVFLLSYMMKTKSLSNLKNLTLSPKLMFLYMIKMLSLGGLPPLGGFIKKIVPMYMFTKNFNYLFILPFLMGSLLSLFFYLRIAFKTNLILFPQHSLSYLNWKTNFPSNFKYFMSMLSSISLLSLMLLPLFFSFM